ncbi:hypothetical protein [Variovorax sp. OV329]|uniref:hypothetical protein n=1 Tax=Variovorax sp. OV329 TaxID=1882825 RepID=UPI0008EBCD56|nr:hypothetical protein [Variovorax sp. OV329]SFM96660.1 hypothetical protein SAMN05444747_11220 [Variovorax sp. OV329]
MSPASLRRAALTALAAAFMLGACSPVFNWREVPIGGDGELVALLPCKPDRASREIPLDGKSVTVSMIGCEAGGATFAVALASATDSTQAERWLSAWQRQSRRQWAGGSIEEHAAKVTHAAPAPTPWRFDANGVQAQEPVRQMWFTHPQRNGAISLYQATVLGTPSAPDAAQTFFEGLRLP